METIIDGFIHFFIFKFTLTKHKRKQIQLPAESINISVPNIIPGLCFHVKMPLATKLVLGAPGSNHLFVPSTSVHSWCQNTGIFVCGIRFKAF